MTSNGHDLVHFNLAVAKYPLDDARMAGFTDQIETVNRIAAASPGFVWTPADGELGDAAAVFGSPLVLPNISTWSSVETLRLFVYEGVHGTAVRDRTRWFEMPRGPAYVLWWVTSGSRPDWAEGRARLSELAASGPTPRAFTFQATFSPDGVQLR